MDKLQENKNCIQERRKLYTPIASHLKISHYGTLSHSSQLFYQKNRNLRRNGHIQNWSGGFRANLCHQVLH